jgi:hypothetical protein
MPPEFMPGLALCRLLYTEAVRPLLESYRPGLPHAAARLGAGSEALGLDTARSVDHDWGPRLQLFLRPDDLAAHGAALDELLTARLPPSCHGWPTNYEPVGARVRVMTATAGPPVHHRVDLLAPAAWLTGLLGFDPTAGVTPLDWLATPTQRLAELTGGAVYHDGLGAGGSGAGGGPGALTLARDRLRWYPEPVWRYVLACQWTRIGQEEAFAGRCAEVGDELGAAVVTARLARDLMRLCLLMARRYPPYSKWLGSAFARWLPDVAGTAAALAGAVAATDHATRQEHLCRAYRDVVARHNALGLTGPLDPEPRPYHDRPYLVIGADRFAGALRAGITDPVLAALPPVGAADQFLDSTDALGDLDLVRTTVATLLAR